MSDKKRHRHSPKQIVEKLEEADRLLNAGQSVGQVLQMLGMSEATYHRWRNQFGGRDGAGGAVMMRWLSLGEMDRAGLSRGVRIWLATAPTDISLLGYNPAPSHQ